MISAAPGSPSMPVISALSGLSGRLRGVNADSATSKKAPATVLNNSRKMPFVLRENSQPQNTTISAPIKYDNKVSYHMLYVYAAPCVYIRACPVFRNSRGARKKANFARRNNSRRKPLRRLTADAKKWYYILSAGLNAR